MPPMGKKNSNLVKKYFQTNSKTRMNQLMKLVTDMFWILKSLVQTKFIIDGDVSQS